MNSYKQTTKYITSDLLSALISWVLIFNYTNEKTFSPDVFISSLSPHTSFFISGLIIYLLGCLIVYYASGYYNNHIFKKSRFDELGVTILSSFLSILILYIMYLSFKTEIIGNSSLKFLTSAFSIHFLLTYLPRLSLTSHINHKVQKRIISFNTLLIGSNQKALDAYLDIENRPHTSGNKFIGFLSVHGSGDKKSALENYIPNLGSIDQIHSIIQQYQVEEVIIAVENGERTKIDHIISMLEADDVEIKIIPGIHDILTGSVKLHSLTGTPLIQVTNQPLPKWQRAIKQFIDIIGAFLGLIVLSPLCIIISLIIILTSGFPIIYSHERIGQYGKPFRIYKFRSMKKNGEMLGPELANKDDKRITPFGRILRKLRLDEIPNLVNVLIGDMSLVGPRPERQYFIDKIMERAPHYKRLQMVKPGVTSLGQVKFGYAENVDQMIKRLRYDLIYIENMSLYLDFKIMIYTILTIIRGHGV